MLGSEKPWSPAFFAALRLSVLALNLFISSVAGQPIAGIPSPDHPKTPNRDLRDARDIRAEPFSRSATSQNPDCFETGNPRCRTTGKHTVKP